MPSAYTSNSVSSDDAALVEAVYSNDIEAMVDLLDAGANPSTVHRSDTALHACIRRHNIVALSTLLDRAMCNPSIDVNVQLIADGTPLHLAVSLRRLHAVSLLLAHPHVEVSACADALGTPLAIATRLGDVNIFIHLLRRDCTVAAIQDALYSLPASVPLPAALREYMHSTPLPATAVHAAAARCDVQDVAAAAAGGIAEVVRWVTAAAAAVGIAKVHGYDAAAAARRAPALGDGARLKDGDSDSILLIPGPPQAADPQTPPTADADAAAAPAAGADGAAADGPDGAKGVDGADAAKGGDAKPPADAAVDAVGAFLAQLRGVTVGCVVRVSADARAICDWYDASGIAGGWLAARAAGHTAVVVAMAASGLAVVAVGGLPYAVTLPGGLLVVHQVGVGQRVVIAPTVAAAERVGTHVCGEAPPLPPYVDLRAPIASFGAQPAAPAGADGGPMSPAAAAAAAAARAAKGMHSPQHRVGAAHSPPHSPAAAAEAAAAAVASGRGVGGGCGLCPCRAGLGLAGARGSVRRVLALVPPYVACGGSRRAGTWWGAQLRVGDRAAAGARAGDPPLDGSPGRRGMGAVTALRTPSQSPLRRQLPRAADAAGAVQLARPVALDTYVPSAARGPHGGDAAYAHGSVRGCSDARRLQRRLTPAEAASYAASGAAGAHSGGAAALREGAAVGNVLHHTMRGLDADASVCDVYVPRWMAGTVGLRGGGVGGAVGDGASVLDIYGLGVAAGAAGAAEADGARIAAAAPPSSGAAGGMSNATLGDALSPAVNLRDCVATTAATTLLEAVVGRTVAVYEIELDVDWEAAGAAAHAAALAAAAAASAACAVAAPRDVAADVWPHAGALPGAAMTAANGGVVVGSSGGSAVTLPLNRYGVVRVLALDVADLDERAQAAGEAGASVALWSWGAVRAAFVGAGRALWRAGKLEGVSTSAVPAPAPAPLPPPAVRHAADDSPFLTIAPAAAPAPAAPGVAVGGSVVPLPPTDDALAAVCVPRAPINGYALAAFMGRVLRGAGAPTSLPQAAADAPTGGAGPDGALSPAEADARAAIAAAATAAVTAEAATLGVPPSVVAQLLVQHKASIGPAFASWPRARVVAWLRTLRLRRDADALADAAESGTIAPQPPPAARAPPQAPDDDDSPAAPPAGPAAVPPPHHPLGGLLRWVGSSALSAVAAADALDVSPSDGRAITTAVADLLRVEAAVARALRDIISPPPPPPPPPKEPSRPPTPPPAAAPTDGEGGDAPADGADRADGDGAESDGAGSASAAATAVEAASPSPSPRWGAAGGRGGPLRAPAGAGRGPLGGRVAGRFGPRGPLGGRGPPGAVAAEGAEDDDEARRRAMFGPRAPLGVRGPPIPGRLGARGPGLAGRGPEGAAAGQGPTSPFGPRAVPGRLAARGGPPGPGSPLAGRGPPGVAGRFGATAAPGRGPPGAAPGRAAPGRLGQATLAFGGGGEK